MNILRSSVQELFISRLKSLRIIREKYPQGSYDMQDDLIMSDISDRVIGEYILGHLSVDPVSSEGLKDCRIKFEDTKSESLELIIPRPVSWGDIEPHRDIELQRYVYMELNPLSFLMQL